MSADSRLILTGNDLRPVDVVEVARRRRRVEIDAGAKRRIGRCREVIEVLVESGQKVYGLTTGFGKLRDVVIAPDDLSELQRNLVMSHACGVGEPFDEDIVRAVMLLRANTLCKGNSGIRLEVVERLVELLNADVYPYIPEKGSVGASGDLAPLSHLALVLIGHPEARVFRRPVASGEATVARRTSYGDFASLAEDAGRDAMPGVEPIELLAKEGLALNNGTQIMSAIGCLNLADAERATGYAELACALSLEALQGVPMAFDQRLHEVRNQPCQTEVAARLREYVAGSEILGTLINPAHLHQAGVHLGAVREACAKIAQQPGREASGESSHDNLRDLAERMGEIVKRLGELIPGDATRRAEWLAGLVELPDEQQIARCSQQVAPLRLELSRIFADLEAATAKAQDIPLDASRNSPEGSLAARLIWIRDETHRVLGWLSAAVPASPPIQDDYSFRCSPQVMACAHHAFAHIHQVLETEINGATDNPLIFPPGLDDPDVAELDGSGYAEWLRADPQHLELCRDAVVGGGNFHGEPVAIAMDYLAIVMAEVANLSERRTAHLVDDHHSNGLPSFLAEDSGLHSGLMIPQYTAAALVSENKVLAHPASVDSVPTCGNTEDHVSMGPHAARKAAEIVRNTLQVVAIELLTAAEGARYRAPLRPGKRLRRFLEHWHGNDGIAPLAEDRALGADLRKARQLLESGQLDTLLLFPSAPHSCRP